MSIQLRHLLLPKLLDVGVLDHEDETSQIQYRPDPRLTNLLVHAREDSKSVQNRLFGALGHPQRRTILSGVVDADDACALTSLTLVVMGDEEGRVPPEVSGREFRRAQTVLVHKHLPRLDASNLITYRKELGMVALTTTPAARRLPEYLTTLDTVEIE
ncbi:DUF7344 domain-containing protein [Haladaptatus caseinilyticus]|uniref:DUF7344 domain-containing protein n=1 Tax=Haladaptatus caseinilyticus TaxID=2993314 RepID=UPI00224B6922|nr:hypothetical protein [Haladaptatus caseinilyticus]